MLIIKLEERSLISSNALIRSLIIVSSGIFAYSVARMMKDRLRGGGLLGDFDSDSNPDGSTTNFIETFFYAVRSNEEFSPPH